MSKIKWLLIFIFIGVPITLLATYAFVPVSRPPMEEFFGGLSQSGMVLFTGFSEQFMQLPYWVAIFGVLAFLFGIFFDRQAWKFILGMRKKLVGDAITGTGLRYQQEPGYQQSPAQPPQQAPPQPPPKEIEAT